MRAPPRRCPVADQLRVAVIGAGYWGPNLIRNFAAFEGTSVRWVCDRDEDRARRATALWGDIAVTPEAGDVLDDPDVDAVAIATPAGTHAELAIAALRAGKHVLIEKPLAATVDEGNAIVATAAERGLTVMCDHTFCYTAPVRKLRSLVEDGTLGDVQFFDSVRINLGLVQSDIDVFWDLAPHDLSILDYVLPSEAAPVSLSAHAADPVGVGHACVGHVAIRLANGALAHVHVNWLSPTKIRTTIVGGSKKMVVWDDLHPSQRLSIYDRGVELQPRDEQERKRTLVAYRTGDMVAPALDGGEALALVVREFAAAIAEQRSPLTDGEAGLRVLRMLAAIDESLAGGGAPVALGAAP